MASKSTTQALTPFGSLLRDHFEKGAELAKQSEGYRLTPPATGNSGYAVGWVQRDLVYTPNDLKKVIEILKQDSALAQQAEKLTTILGKKASRLTKADRTFLEQNRRRIDDALSSDAGRKVLEDISAAQAKKLEQKVNELAAKAGPLAREFMNSTEGKLRIADYLNQFGTNTDRLEPFLQGREVMLNNGRNRIKLDRPMTVEKWRDYVGSTLHGTRDPGDVDRRFRAVDKALERQGLKPDAPRREGRAAPERDEEARVPARSAAAAGRQ